MCTLGHLARIIIKEGHIALTSKHFCNTSTLANLFMLCTQVALISATIPPTARGMLEQLLGLKHLFQVIRASTVCKNIQICIQHLSVDEACDKVTIAAINDQTKSFGPVRATLLMKSQ